MNYNKDNNDSDKNEGFSHSFKFNGKSISMLEFLTLMNNELQSDKPEGFLPVLATLEREQAMFLIEMTHGGKLNPSYNAYGFILLKSLCDNDEQVFMMYAQGAEFIKSTGLIDDETLATLEKDARESVKKLFKDGKFVHLDEDSVLKVKKTKKNKKKKE